MGIGDYRHFVTLENPGAPQPDAGGGFTSTWVPLDPAGVWAAKEPATAARIERMFAGTVSSEASWVISFAYHPGVSTKTRITHEGRVFHVVGVEDPYGTHVTTITACTEVVP